MPWYILTERLHGDEGGGKMAIVDEAPTKQPLVEKRRKILEARFSKPLFNEPVNDPRWRREQEEDLEVWREV